MRLDNLRAEIIRQYHTVLNFSKVLHWSNRKAYAIVNGKQEPSAKDIEVMCNALGIEIPDNMRLLFFVA